NQHFAWGGHRLTPAGEDGQPSAHGRGPRRSPAAKGIFKYIPWRHGLPIARRISRKARHQTAVERIALPAGSRSPIQSMTRTPVGPRTVAALGACDGRCGTAGAANGGDRTGPDLEKLARCAPRIR